MCRLWDARGLRGIVPVVPGDVSPGLVTLTAERLALEHSRFLGGSLPVADAEDVRFLTDMNLAAGRRYQLLEHVGISPLRLDPGALDIALLFQHNPDLDVTLGGFMPIAGATAPLDPRSALVQAVAESVGFDILCSVLGFPDGFGLGLYPFDFRYGAIVFGSPEWCLYDALCLQMMEYLSGRPVLHGNLRSTGKRPDSQATCERAASALWQALLGVRHFGSAGQLSTDEVFSPQQAVLDREILAYVERVVRGIDLGPPEVDALELIRAGVREGSFLGVMDTVTRFRDFYSFPDIFRHWSVRGWRAAEKPSVLDEAWARAQEEIATSRFHLADDQARAVEKLYGKACGYIRGRG
jgi:trimethylamine:corrinoid methyltransferase-like protein